MSKTQQRQFAAKIVALYSPKALCDPGAVTHYATVNSIDVISRGDIQTPWAYSRNPNELMVMYKLSEITEKGRLIRNVDPSGKGIRFPSHRWTSCLSFERAEVLQELLFETEPEWRLYEDMQALKIEFRIIRDRIILVDPDDPRGRVWFETDDGLRVRYAGAAGFELRHPSGRNEYLAGIESVLSRFIE